MKKIFVILCAFVVAACASTPKIETAKNFEIDKYLGTWYEIARFDNPFEEGLKDVAAVYKKGKKGEIEITNSGFAEDGEFSVAKGKAYIPDEKDASKIKVSFFGPFYSDYYVLAFSPDYKWALVGSSNPDYLWLLSREKIPPEAYVKEMLQLAKSRGYDTDKLIFIDQR